MESVQAVSRKVDHHLNYLYSAEEIALRRSFISHMNRLYNLAFSRTSGPRMQMHMSGSVMEGFNPLHLLGMLQERQDGSQSRQEPSPTDVDIMFVLKGLSVSDTAHEYKKPGVLQLEMLESSVYCTVSSLPEDLEVLKSNLFFMGPTDTFVDVVEGKNMINSDKFRGEFYKYLETGGYASINRFGETVARMTGNQFKQSGIPYTHGPAATNATLLLLGIASETEIMEYDLVPAFQCSQWPGQIAEKWKNRIRSWPTTDAEEKAISSGCHVVPVGSPLSSNPLEWRLSFSKAETVLINSWNNVQQKCYITLKALFYRHMKDPKTLSTYHIKTAMFWACERESEAFWTKDNLVGCVRQLLEDLKIACSKKSLMHYFVSEYNLLEQIDPSELRKTTVKIEGVLSDLSGSLLALASMIKPSSTKSKLPASSDDQSADHNRLKELMEIGIQDWDFVCAQVMHGTKEQMYSGNAKVTIENLRKELEKLEIEEAAGSNGWNGNGEGYDFLSKLYFQVVIENLAWLLLGEAAWESDHRKQCDLFRETGKYMSKAIESGSQTAIVKYAYFLYKAGKYEEAVKICKNVMQSEQKGGKTKSFKATEEVNSENVVSHFESMMARRMPDYDVIMQGEDHYSLEEPLYSMVAAATPFCAFTPKAFAYIVLVMCFNAMGDQDGVHLTLKEYSWYAKKRSSQLLQGKELIVVAVLCHHFGYVADALEHSTKAALCDARFSQVSTHIKEKGVQFHSDVNDWIRGVMCSTFVAHAMYLVGAEWLYNFADNYFWL